MRSSGCILRNPSIQPRVSSRAKASRDSGRNNASSMQRCREYANPGFAGCPSICVKNDKHLIVMFGCRC